MIPISCRETFLVVVKYRAEISLSVMFRRRINERANKVLDLGVDDEAPDDPQSDPIGETFGFAYI